MSGKQMAGLAIGLVVGLILATYLLSPVLAKLPINWNTVPLMAIFGALGYSAYPKRGMAFASQAILSTVMVATIWLQLGSQGYQWGLLILGALVSGALMEGWVAFLPQIKKGAGDKAWLREAAWLAIMAMIGTATFFLIVTRGVTGLNIYQWIMSAVFGVVGWFIGDLDRQYMLHRQTGSWN
jgi:hypothetical protein